MLTVSWACLSVSLESHYSLISRENEISASHCVQITWPLMPCTKSAFCQAGVDGWNAKAFLCASLAQAQASLSEGSPFQKHLGNTFDKWLCAGGWEGRPRPRAPPWLPALGPWMQDHLASSDVRQAPHSCVATPRPPHPYNPATARSPCPALPAGEPSGASGPLGWEGARFPREVAIWKHAQVKKTEERLATCSGGREAPPGNL